MSRERLLPVLMAFVLLAIGIYFVSSIFANYWPLGLLQAGCVVLSPVLLLQGRGRSTFIVLVAMGLASLAFGCVLAFPDFQPVWSWRACIYLLGHLLWLVALMRVFGSLPPLVLMRFAVAIFLLFLSLINAGDIPESQKAIALLEGLLFLVASFSLGRSMLAARRLWVWIAGVVVALCASNLLAARDDVGLQDWWRVIQIGAHFLLGVALWVWMKRDEQAGFWVAGSVLMAVAVYTIVLLVTWFSLEQPASYDWFFDPPLFGHIRHVGYFSCVGVLVGAWSVLTLRGGVRVLAWVGYVLALSILLWSGGRGASIAAFLGVCSLGAMAIQHKKIVWLGLFVGLLLALLLSALFPVDQPGLGWLSALMRSDSASSVNELSTNRLIIWAYLWDFIVQRPWFGWGGEAFHAVSDYNVNQAHNLVLQLLLEWGVVGSVVIGGPLLVLAVRGGWCYRVVMARGGGVMGLGGGLVVALLLLSLVDGVFYHGLPSAYLALGYAAMLAGLKVANQSSV